MQFGGRYRIGASRLKVWAALNDTEILARTIPGCTRMAWVTDAALEAAITADLGIAKPTITGTLELSNVVPAETYTLSGRGKGGLLGLAHGAADIALTDLGDDCILAFTATAGASNTIMKIGKALIGSAAQHVIDGFFKRFAEAMGAELEVLPHELPPPSASEGDGG
jgi:hypothetical protein